MILAPPPIVVQSVVVYKDAIVVSAWKGQSGLNIQLALSDGTDRIVWIPDQWQRLPVQYRASTRKAEWALENWNDSDQGPFTSRPMFFNLARSHASVQILRTKAGLVLSWLKRRPAA